MKTRTGTLMGTPIYMSPEQCRGTQTVDHRSDIYSLGVILFEMLAGQPPFVSEGFGELVNMHLNVAPPAPSSRPERAASLDAIVLKMLDKNPEQRFTDMGGLQAALKASGGTMFVVRGSASSSPDLAGRTPAPQPVSIGNPRLSETTLSAGAGERTEQLGVPRKGRGAALVIGVAAAAVVAGVFLFRDGEKVAQQREQQAAREEAARPVVPTTTAPPKVDPTPAPSTDPPAPKTVTVHVESDPPGASVVNAASGGVLGVTPLTLTRPKGGSLKLRLEKEGYNSNSHDIALEADQTIELSLEQKPKATPKPHPHHSHASPADDEPAKL